MTQKWTSIIESNLIFSKFWLYIYIYIYIYNSLGTKNKKLNDTYSVKLKIQLKFNWAFFELCFLICTSG